MEFTKNGRIVMLAVSGLLFGVSGLGWWMHSQPQPKAETQPVASAPPESASATAAASVVQAFAPSTEAPRTQPGTAYPATSYEEAAKIARASVRPDMFAPVHEASVDTAQAPTLQREQLKRHASGFVVPPPPVGAPTFEELRRMGESATRQYEPVVAYEIPKHDKLTVDDCHLVGLIDGKAIFKIRRDVARELALPTAFTLGEGESFSNVKLREVTGETATLHDGLQVAVKEIGSIR
jgi:zona occludens toxin (predicted ATPase)